MKYKKGDLVRVVNYHHKYNNKISLVDEVDDNWVGENIYGINGVLNYIQNKNLEPVTHLTTKEFIKLVEDMGYEVDVRIGVIFIKTKNFIDVGWVRTDGERCAAFNFECDKILLDIFYLYANTPLELREEKEQLYTLELPNNDNEDFKYYNYNCEDDKQYYFGDNTNDTLYQTHFTQKEIENLDNQELIKALVKREVKENEQ